MLRCFNLNFKRKKKNIFLMCCIEWRKFIFTKEKTKKKSLDSWLIPTAEMYMNIFLLRKKICEMFYSLGQLRGYELLKKKKNYSIVCVYIYSSSLFLKSKAWCSCYLMVFQVYWHIIVRKLCLNNYALDILPIRKSDYFNPLRRLVVLLQHTFNISIKFLNV